MARHRDEQQITVVHRSRKIALHREAIGELGVGQVAGIAPRGGQGGGMFGAMRPERHRMALACQVALTICPKIPEFGFTNVTALLLMKKSKKSVLNWMLLLKIGQHMEVI